MSSSLQWSSLGETPRLTKDGLDVASRRFKRR